VIGTPVLVEADVPIAFLPRHSFLTDKIARRFLISRGYCTREEIEHEDRTEHPLPAEYVRRIIRFPEPDFVALTGSSAWETPPVVPG
jgi:hypothetical protein